MFMEVKEAYKSNSAENTISKTQNIHNKESIIKILREKDQVTHKRKPIRITPDFSIETP